MSKVGNSFEKKLTGRKSALLEEEDSFGSDEDMTTDPSTIEMEREERQRKKDQKLQEIITEEIKELEKDEIEMFDQYLEMIMTFGYITMFAAAFPFGATLTSLFVYFESKNDMFVLTRNSRRPFVTKMVSIGVWEYTLDFFTFVSIFTNIFLCCYASNQIDPLLPWLKMEKKFSKHALGAMVGIEHLLIFAVVLLRVYMSSDPNWLSLYK